MVRTLFHGLCEKFQRYPSFTIFVIKRNPNKWLLFYFSFLAIYFIITIIKTRAFTIQKNNIAHNFLGLFHSTNTLKFGGVRKYNFIIYIIINYNFTKNNNKFLHASTLT